MRLYILLLLLFFSTPVFSQTGVLTAYICVGDTVKIRANSPEAIRYQWYRNGQLIEGNDSDSLMAYLPGTYTVEAVSEKGCVQAANPVYLEMVAPYAANDATFARHATPTPIAVLENDTSSCAPIDTNSVEIVDLPRKGTVRREGSLVYYMPHRLEKGADVFTYRYRDMDGTYSNEATVNITVENPEPVIIYPNPGDDEVHLVIVDDDIVEWRLIDVHGRVFYREPVRQQEFVVDIRDLAAAPYFFTFVTRSNRTYNYKFVKR